MPGTFFQVPGTSERQNVTLAPLTEIFKRHGFAKLPLEMAGNGDLQAAVFLWKGRVMSKGVGRGTIVRHSFVVRVWREAGRPEWRGWVQHAGTRESTYVQSLEELLAFIEGRTGKLAGRGRERLR